jgi:hypothetical protein
MSPVVASQPGQTWVEIEESGEDANIGPSLYIYFGMSSDFLIMQYLIMFPFYSSWHCTFVWWGYSLWTTSAVL